MNFKCPSCRKTIFNRRIPNCEFCGFKLPEELILSEQDKESLNKEYRNQQAKLSRERSKRIAPVHNGAINIDELNIVDTSVGAPVYLKEPSSTIRCKKCGLSYDFKLSSCNHCEVKANSDIIEELHIPHSEQMESNTKIGKWFFLITILLGVLFFIFLK